MTLPKTTGLLLALLILGASGCAWLRPDLAARVATGTTAHDLCSETFVSGLDPDQAFAESVQPRPGLQFVAPLVGYRVDRDLGEVRATLAGGFASRAVYQGSGGCTLVGPAVPPVRLQARGLAPAVPQPAVALPVAPTSPALQSAVDEAFAENVPGKPRHTKAVLVLHRGRVVAERYAPGYGPATPMLGFSLSKSVTSALVGLLVGDGRLQLDTPLALAHAATPPVTLEQALRMTTGLDLDETGSGFDASNHLLYVHTDDMAAFAREAQALAPPGTRWAYSSASTHLVARQLHDVLGPADAVRRFAQERLFGPLGMQQVTMEADAAGTLVGAHYMLATARDWALLGQLYLDHGVALSGQRVLPESWVHVSTQPTLNTSYGAGWWLNRRAGGSPGPGTDMPLMPDVPADAFYGLGNLGQYLVVVPSQHLVVVRLGRAHTHDFDLAGMNRLLARTIAALGT